MFILLSRIHAEKGRTGVDSL